MELVKLKRHSRKRDWEFSEEGLKKRKEASRVQMVLDNPMKKEDARLKTSMKLKGKATSQRTLFKKGNQYGKLRKNTKVSDAQKINQSIKMKGRKLHSKEHKKELSKRFKENNPMKNPETVKRNIESRKRNGKIAANQKRRIASLTNPKVKKTWFKPKVLITTTMIDDICTGYSKGTSMEKLSKIYGYYRRGIKKILVNNNVQIRKGFDWRKKDE